MAVLISAPAARTALLALRIHQLELARLGRVDECAQVAGAADHIETAIAVHDTRMAVPR